MTIEERDTYLRGVIQTKKEAKGNGKVWAEADKMLRNEAIYYEMGLGKSYSKIMFDLSERWNCSQQTISDYLKAARQALIETNKETIEEYRNKMMEKLERLAKDAEEAGDRKAMLAAYEQINKMSCVYTQKVEADVKGEIKFDFGE
jgi:hypothetical protein